MKPAYSAFLTELATVVSPLVEKKDEISFALLAVDLVAVLLLQLPAETQRQAVLQLLKSLKRKKKKNLLQQQEACSVVRPAAAIPTVKIPPKWRSTFFCLFCNLRQNIRATISTLVSAFESFLILEIQVIFLFVKFRGLSLSVSVFSCA